jgi:hypothetical protein
MTAQDIRELKAGDRLILRKWDSRDSEIRKGVSLEIVKIVKRHYGPVLIAVWGEDDCELRFSDYLRYLQHI